MVDIDSIILHAKKNNNIIDEEYLYELNFDETEYEYIINLLYENKIEIKCKLELDIIDKVTGRGRVLTTKEERELFRRYKSGDKEAEEILLRCNEGLVRTISKFYSQNIIANGYDIEDAYQEGRLGILDAMKRFDLSRNLKFSTYAVWWIRTRISRFSETCNHIKLPVRSGQKLAKIRSFYNEYLKKYCKNPTLKEISEFLNISIEEVKIIIRASSVSSIDAPLFMNDNSDVSINNYIVDESVNNEYEQLLDKILCDQLKEIAFKGLNEREIEIINLRFGFNGKDAHTLSDIANKLGLTRERIRQIEETTLKKMRKRIYFNRRQIELSIDLEGEYSFGKRK